MELRLQENLKSLLAARGLKAAELARVSGVAPSVISEWMSGRVPRNIVNLQRIAQKLGVPLEELCFGKPEPIAKDGPDSPKWKRRQVRCREISPLILPIQGSGLLEFNVRWSELEDIPEKKEEEKDK